LDMTMPKMGGLEVLPLLRGVRGDIPIVLMSGYDEAQLANNLGDARVTFLHKPFRKDDLKNALSHVLDAQAPESSGARAAPHAASKESVP